MVIFMDFGIFFFVLHKIVTDCNNFVIFTFFTKDPVNYIPNKNKSQVFKGFFCKMKNIICAK